MQRPGAAEGDRARAARVVAAVDRDQPERLRHVLLRRRRSPARRAPVEAELRGKRLEGVRAASTSSARSPASGTPGEPPEHQVGVGHCRLPAAAAVAGGSGVDAGALWPDRRIPAGRPRRSSRHLRLPIARRPSALRSGRRLELLQVRQRRLGPGRRHASKLVPPMSAAIRSFGSQQPADRASDYPAGGPERTSRIGLSLRPVRVITPPFERKHEQLPDRRARRTSRSSCRHVAGMIGRRKASIVGAGALVLAPLAEHLARDRDRHSGQLPDQLARPPFVLRVDGTRRGRRSRLLSTSPASQGSRGLSRTSSSSSGDQHVPVGADPLADAEAVARDQWLGLDPVEVEARGRTTRWICEDVGEAPVVISRRVRPCARSARWWRWSCRGTSEVILAVSSPALAKESKTVDGVVGVEETFVIRNSPVSGVVEDEIGERPTGVDACSDAHLLTAFHRTGEDCRQS